MSAFKLLTESSSDIEFLTESKDGVKELYIEGIFAQAEKKNGNGRIYPIEVMTEAANKYNESFVYKNRALGEIDHPDYPMPKPENAAIRIVEFRPMSPGSSDFYGKALVLNTPKGQTVRGLAEGGYQWGISTRGLGNIKESKGVKWVQPGYFMTAHDLVDNPSGPDCYPNALMESVSWINESGVWTPIVDEKENSKINEQLFLEKMEQFLKRMKK